MSFRLRPASLADGESLARLAAVTFRDTYASTAPHGPLEAHIAQRFTPAEIRAEVTEPACHILLAELDAKLLGYVLLRHDRPPPPSVDAVRPIQLERLYVERSVQGGGVGHVLQEAACDVAVDRGHDVLWLTVWEANPGAIAFYRRQGFEDVGAVSFSLGGEPQTDRVMARRLKAA